MSADQPRFCRECGKPLIRHPHTSAAHWAARRYCSRVCAARYQYGKQHRWMRSPFIPYGHYGDIEDEVFNDER